MADQLGMADIRGNNVSKAIKGILAKKYKLMQVLSKEKSSDWSESYYTETNTILSAGGETFSVRGIGRGASFPNLDASWTKNTAYHKKWGGEATIFLEDDLTSAIGVRKRSIIKVAQAIVDDVDNYIYSTLTGTSGILTGAASANWDSVTVADRDPVRDILTGIQTMDENDVDALENGYLLVSPKDYTNLMMNSKVVNNVSFKTADVVSNGKVGQIAGLTIIKTTSVNADEAMIIVGQQAATWVSAQELKTNIEEDAGISYTIRSWQFGHLQVHQPKKIYVITNTQL